MHPTLRTAETRIQKEANQLVVTQNTTIDTDFITARISSWQAHLHTESVTIPCVW